MIHVRMHYLLFKTNCLIFVIRKYASFILCESSKPLSPQKEHLLVELEEANRSLVQKEEDMRQLE